MIVWYVVLLQRYGNAAVGASRKKTTVLPPFAALMLPALRTPLNAERALPPPFGSVLRLNVAMTSAAVNGEPSWNLTPWRRLNAHWVPSLFGFQFSASEGESVLSWFVAVRILAADRARRQRAVVGEQVRLHRPCRGRDDAEAKPAAGLAGPRGCLSRCCVPGGSESGADSRRGKTDDACVPKEVGAARLARQELVDQCVVELARLRVAELVEPLQWISFHMTLSLAFYCRHRSGR